MEDIGAKEDLIKRVKRKEEGAFDSLYEQYKYKAYRTAVFLTGNEEDAQDAIQDTFVTVYLKIEELKDLSLFSSWFYRILTRNAIRRSKERMREFSQDAVNMSLALEERESKQNPLVIILNQEENYKIKAAIEELDEKHRMVLVLYYYNEFSTKEISYITGCMEGTVKSRLFSARKKLEQKLLIDEQKQCERNGYQKWKNK